MTSRTSPIISGFEREVGSSKSMIFGLMARAGRWPPLLLPARKLHGYTSALSGMPTFSRSRRATASASARGVF
jgi:hypothetical protein